MGAFAERARGIGAARGEAGQIEPGAKGAALAREHDRAQALQRPQLFAHRDDGIEHGRIERIELVGAIEPNLRDTIVAKGQRHAVVGH